MVHLSLKLPLIFWPSRFVLDFLAEENRIERFEPLESWRWTATAAPRCHSIKRIVLSTTTKPILRLGCSGLLSMPLLLGSKFWQIPDLDQNISAKLWFRYASPVNLVTDKEKWVKTQFAASTWHFIVTRRRSSPTTPTNLRTWQSLLYGKNSVWSGLYADSELQILGTSCTPSSQSYNVYLSAWGFRVLLHNTEGKASHKDSVPSRSRKIGLRVGIHVVSLLFHITSSMFDACD